MSQELDRPIDRGGLEPTPSHAVDDTGLLEVRDEVVDVRGLDAPERHVAEACHERLQPVVDLVGPPPHPSGGVYRKM